MLSTTSSRKGQNVQEIRTVQPFIPHCPSFSEPFLFPTGGVNIALTQDLSILSMLKYLRYHYNDDNGWQDTITTKKILLYILLFLGRVSTFLEIKLFLLQHNYALLIHHPLQIIEHLIKMWNACWVFLPNHLLSLLPSCIPNISTLWGLHQFGF